MFPTCSVRAVDVPLPGTLLCRVNASWFPFSHLIQCVIVCNPFFFYSLTTPLQGASVSDITFFDDVASNHKGKGNAAQSSRAAVALSAGDARRAAYALGLKKDMRNKRK